MGRPLLLRLHGLYCVLLIRRVGPRVKDVMLPATRGWASLARLTTCGLLCCYRRHVQRLGAYCFGWGALGRWWGTWVPQSGAHGRLAWKDRLHTWSRIGRWGGPTT